MTTTEPGTGLQPRKAFVASIMGMPMSVHVRGPQARGSAVAAAVERAFDALRADETLFSTFLPDSEVSRIQRGELSLHRAHPRVREVAGLCSRASALTGGAFSAQLPGPDGRRVFDPTGIVKGWAVDSALTGLLSDLAPLGAHDVLICAGGDIAAACLRTDTPDWRVGIEDPRDSASVLRVVSLRTGGVATSGTAARGHHIIDPATDVPAADDLLSATVIGSSLTWADVHATAAFVRGRQAAAWLAGLQGYVAVLLTSDDQLITVGDEPGREPTPLLNAALPVS